MNFDTFLPPLFFLDETLICLLRDDWETGVLGGEYNNDIYEGTKRVYCNNEFMCIKCRI